MDENKQKRYEYFLKKYGKGNCCITQKSGLMTKADLLVAFKKLKDSVEAYESKNEQIIWPNSQVHFSHVFNHEEYSFVCDSCNARDTLLVASRDIIGNPFEGYPKVSKKFSDCGYRLELKCFCGKCMKRRKGRLDKSLPESSRLIFEFYQEGSNTPVDSFPNDNYNAGLDDYLIALEFLKGAHTVTELADKTGTHYYSDTYIKIIARILINGEW